MPTTTRSLSLKNMLLYWLLLKNSTYWEPSFKAYNPMGAIFFQIITVTKYAIVLYTMLTNY